MAQQSFTAPATNVSMMTRTHAASASNPVRVIAAQQAMSAGTRRTSPALEQNAETRIRSPAVKLLLAARHSSAPADMWTNGIRLSSSARAQLAIMAQMQPFAVTGRKTATSCHVQAKTQATSTKWSPCRYAEARARNVQQRTLVFAVNQFPHRLPAAHVRGACSRARLVLQTPVNCRPYQEHATRASMTAMALANTSNAVL